METQSMLVSTKRKLTIVKNLDLDFSLKIRDHELEVIDTTKYLGLQIENSLDWKYHVNVLSSKISIAVGFLTHAKSILLLETLNKLYAGTVEPHFRYILVLYGAAVVRTNSSCDAPKIPLVCRLGWKTIEELIAHESELMVFKSAHGLAPQYTSDLFTKISQ